MVWGCAGSHVTITVCFRWLVERVLLVVECHTSFITNSLTDCRSLTSAFVVHPSSEIVLTRFFGISYFRFSDSVFLQNMFGKYVGEISRNK